MNTKQLKKLPKGCKVVVQSNYKERNGWAKYGIYSANGMLIALTAYGETNKRKARQLALTAINREIIDGALIHGRDISDSIINKYS